jgi:hypothetical protein
MIQDARQGRTGGSSKVIVTGVTCRGCLMILLKACLDNRPLKLRHCAFTVHLIPRYP